jgi:hypothetical protein
LLLLSPLLSALPLLSLSSLIIVAINISAQQWVWQWWWWCSGGGTAMVEAAQQWWWTEAIVEYDTIELFRTLFCLTN